MRPLLLQTEAPELADIREPIEIISWGLIAAITALVLFLLFVAYVLWQRRQRRLATEEHIRHQVSPIDKAREAFKSLRKKQPELTDKAYISEVSGVMRDYLEDAYKLPAPERTTEEFFELLRAEQTFDAEMQAQLMRFLQQSDLIKFARQELGATDREPLLEGAESFVETAELKRSEIDQAGTAAEEKAG